MYVVDREREIWVPVDSKQVERLVAENYDGNDNCKRRGDYAGIADHAKSLVSREAFFDDAPIGVATPEGFHRIVGDEVTVEPLTPALRQRVILDVTPRVMPTPEFDKFLHETFKSEVADEEAQQIALVQEIAGSIMLGLMHRYQKAVLFYDEYGRSGKGTLESILRRLVPKLFVTAVSPFQWDHEYFLVQLAGSRLNVVGEVPDNKPIPAAIFKSVIGGDLITGRNPAGRPIAFKNGAAHLFMSNHPISSRDHSEAFFARWVMVHFLNSRLQSGLPLDPGLGDRIASQELPGIAHWAIQGAKRLLQNNGFSRTASHDRLMAKWRRSNSSVEEFIHDDCELGSHYKTLRADLYSSYKGWCFDNGRTAFSKSRMKDLLQANVALGISWASLNGHEIFRGVRLKPDERQGVDYGGDLQQLH
jgi:P4 family phage/plasmid primase-like protien